MPDQHERYSNGTPERHLMRVTGVVQGVGFRPFVHALATTLGLDGWVANDTEGVTIQIEGAPETLEQFARELRDSAPPMASIDHIERASISPTGHRGFEIAASNATTAGTGRIAALPPDLAVCDDCTRELFDPTDRRYRYPFITCTNCGPRFTIALELPYDRAATTMAGFALCPTCRSEYDDPADRRFHAQPLACADCGPRLELLGPLSAEPTTGDAALRGAQRLIEAGAVVAVKGIGGYHLVCDATNPEAVAQLRERKRRGRKPLAAMVAGVHVIEAHVHLSDVERTALSSPQRPIVLIHRPADGPAWFDTCAPGAADIGVMLPYAPLHHLLFDGLTTDALVCTSGNLSDEPIATDDNDAQMRLASIADAWLRHDRPIHTPCDDSVVRSVGGHVSFVRRARGWTPLPITVGDDDSAMPVLALGGDLKGAVCVAAGRRAWMSQHLGDLGELGTYVAARNAVHQLLHLTDIEPAAIAIDAHPAYVSARLGREFAEYFGVRTIAVQHHHAHLASVLAEHARPDRRVIGVTFDGTGYGPDGTIWGGEVLVGDAGSFERVEHLRAVPLPGVDAAIEHPARSALAHLWAAGCPWDDRLACVQAVAPTDRAVIRTQLDRSVATVPTSSMGRLFDAVASLADVRHTVDYEAQAAIELEAAADRDATGQYCFPEPVSGASDAGPVIAAVVRDMLGGATPGAVSMRFHRGVTQWVVDACVRARAAHHTSTVALTGGVFQNALLAQGCSLALDAAGFEVLVHRLVPTNDGGLALGQAVVARRQFARRQFASTASIGKD